MYHIARKIHSIILFELPETHLLIFHVLLAMKANILNMKLFAICATVVFTTFAIAGRTPANSESGDQVGKASLFIIANSTW